MPLTAKRILVAVNGTPHCENAFRWACHIAREAKAELYAIHVIEVPLAFSLEAEIPEDTERAERILSHIEDVAREEKCRRLQARSIRARQAGPAIVLEAVDRQMDVLILGVHFQQNFGSCTLGQTATYILDNASCQVILWREPAPAPIFARA
jgi:nucleotide-binding universal stress UspA family protein